MQDRKTTRDRWTYEKQDEFKRYFLLGKSKGWLYKHYDLTELQVNQRIRSYGLDEKVMDNLKAAIDLFEEACETAGFEMMFDLKRKSR